MKLNFLDILFFRQASILSFQGLVKKSYFKMGIVIAHEGYLIDQTNLIHASSEFGKTVNVNFLDYLFKDGEPRFDGVMFYKINPI